jgi:hypothetical protein
MIRAQSLLRTFVERKISSTWDSGFLFGFGSGFCTHLWIQNHRNDRERHKFVPSHTGDDCLYCKTYARLPPEKPMI